MSRMPETVQRLVIKVGASVLTDQQGCLLPQRVNDLVAEVASALHRRCQPIIVSSGAIACGMARLKLTRRPRVLAQLQACAAVGQGELMHLYTTAFMKRQVVAAQVLLTQEDLSDRARYRNAKQTLLTLLHQRVVPIVNENDTVAVEEITFGDNDRLAALVASAVDAQLLVLLSDVDGLLESGRPIERIETLDQAMAVPLHGGGRATTKGGMGSKLEAARIVGHCGIPMIIANGTRPSVVSELLAGQPVGTLFVPPRDRLASRKWWIAFAQRQPRGKLIVDAGAAQALGAGKSLLVSGIREVQGRFETGDLVGVMDGSGVEIGRGISNFSSSEVSQVRGLRSTEAARALGLAHPKEVIHRDSLVLVRELQQP